MKKAIAMLVLVAAVSAANAGQLENATSLGRVNIAQAKAMEVPVPVMEKVEAPGMKNEASGLLKSSSMQNYGWRHVSLKATDGTEIKVDYNMVGNGGLLEAAAIWINVSNPAFRGDEKIGAALMNYSADNPMFPTVMQTQKVDLKYVDGKFTGQAAVPVLVSEGSMGHQYRQELAIVVNGNWLTDPVSKQHNFKFKMAK